jgi:hypothetical protein
MKEESHKKLTQTLCYLLADTVEYFPLFANAEEIASQAEQTDRETDLELIYVEYFRDADPHDGNDKAHYYDREFFGLLGGKHYFTAFNHFIDIRKGKENALFDDFDGYSYYHGSASKDQHEEELGDKLDHLLIGWWLNDEYVHVPGRGGYRDCSPAVVRYSFPEDKGLYTTTTEAKKRFPLAESTGKKDCGIPYSVFMPVDNLARYWYKQFESSRVPQYLGYVMHAIQDASVPHHAAGCLGNWHRKYEEELAKQIEMWVVDTEFQNDVKSLLYQWNKVDEEPPNSLDVDDYVKTPHRNWPIDMLVTWMALHAHRAYSAIYQGFKNGWSMNVATMRQLTEKAAALCMLVLYDVSVAEQCRIFDPATLIVKKVGWEWAVIIPGSGFSIALEQFPTEADAQRGLEIIQHYQMTSRCTVGQMTYYLSNGEAPATGWASAASLGGQPHISFDLTKVQVKRFEGPPERWVVMEDDKEIADFGSDAEAAYKMVYLIKKYEFNHICWVGDQSNPSMRYFLKGSMIEKLVKGPVVIRRRLPHQLPTVPG